MDKELDKTKTQEKEEEKETPKTEEKAEEKNEEKETPDQKEEKAEDGAGTEFPVDKSEKDKKEHGVSEPEKDDESKKQAELDTLKGKYNALMIKDALTDAGAEFGLTRAQIPFIARMMNSEKLITAKGEVDTKELTSQLKEIMGAFPGLKKEPEEDKAENKITLGAPMENDDGAEALREKLMRAAGLK